ncbi:MAG: hypothetical protein HQK54_04415 [Oligoflexales bacterium]|nr:hypothetical protein [Oligoflexales bacterium]
MNKKTGYRWLSIYFLLTAFGLGSIGCTNGNALFKGSSPSKGSDKPSDSQQDSNQDKEYDKSGYSDPKEDPYQGTAEYEQNQKTSNDISKTPYVFSTPNNESAKVPADTGINSAFGSPPATYPYGSFPGQVTSSGATGNTAAPEIVDGMEVYSNCSLCVNRARQLSAQCGFTADISKTVNLGFYKVDPSRGLCDIHFMANMYDEIADHEGHDSILGNQVALYCPCQCGWASQESDGYGYDNGYNYDEYWLSGKM